MSTTSRPTDDATSLPWARTETMPYAAASAPAPPATAPALNPPMWSGRKTAIAAALAIGISSSGAVAAAAALPSGSAQSDQGTFQRGGFGRGGQGGLGGQQALQPGQQSRQLPGQPASADPNSSTT